MHRLVLDQLVFSVKCLDSFLASVVREITPKLIRRVRARARRRPRMHAGSPRSFLRHLEIFKRSLGSFRAKDIPRTTSRVCGLWGVAVLLLWPAALACCCACQLPARCTQHIADTTHETGRARTLLAGQL